MLLYGSRYKYKALFLFLDLVGGVGGGRFTGSIRLHHRAGYRRVTSRCAESVLNYIARPPQRSVRQSVDLSPSFKTPLFLHLLQHATVVANLHANTRTHARIHADTRDYMLKHALRQQHTGSWTVTPVAFIVASSLRHRRCGRQEDVRHPPHNPNRRQNVRPEQS